MSKTYRRMTKADKRSLAAYEQRRWIRECGGDLAGYIRHYGSASDPGHYGEGGEAIYAADMEALARIERG